MNFLNEQNLNNQNKSLVCKVMTSYGTTLVVILQPNQITQKALSEAIELKHKTLYGEEYGSNVRCTRIDGFSRVNDEGAPCGVSYPIDDDSLKTCEFVSYLAQLTKGGTLTIHDASEHRPQITGRRRIRTTRGKMNAKNEEERRRRTRRRRRGRRRRRRSRRIRRFK